MQLLPKLIGAIEAQYLDVQSNGVVMLNGLNKVDYFSAVSNNADIAFHAVVPNGGRLSLGSSAAACYIDAGTGNLTIAADGGIDGSGNISQVNMLNRINANGLTLVGDNSRFWLYGNDYLTISTLAARVGTMAIGSVTGFNIGTVGSVSGITSTGIWNNDTLYKEGIGLESGGTITQTAPVNVTALYLGKGSFALKCR